MLGCSLLVLPGSLSAQDPGYGRTGQHALREIVPAEFPLWMQRLDLATSC